MRLLNKYKKIAKSAWYHRERFHGVANKLADLSSELKDEGNYMTGDATLLQEIVDEYDKIGAALDEIIIKAAHAKSMIKRYYK